MLAISCVVAILAAVFASGHPDGLEWVAEKLGFVNRGVEIVKGAPMPDYNLGVIKSSIISTVVAGLIGVLVTFLVVYFIGKIVLLKMKIRRTPF